MIHFFIFQLILLVFSILPLSEKACHYAHASHSDAESKELLNIKEVISTKAFYETFPISNALRKRIDFWKKVYTEFSTQEGIIHDAKYPEIIFEKVDLKSSAQDFSLSPKEKRRKSERRITDIKKFYQNLLLSIHKKQKAKISLNDAEKRIFELYQGIDEQNKFYRAAHDKRVRFQLGQKDRFLQGLYYSGQYLKKMEEIFLSHGLPLELTRLPFVESSFNVYARSKVGASGIWQFMRSTGKLYLKINDTIDERNDPIRATEAAAELLKQNYEALQNWPLAITAYNHGRKGLMRAVRKVGSDEIDDIIDGYRSRNFGFASSNFYSEFIAACEAYRDAEKHFGSVARDIPKDFSDIIISNYISIFDLATYTKIPFDTLKEFNPALSESVFSGTRYIPSGHILRVPSNLKDNFLTLYSQIPASKKFTSQKTVHIQKTKVNRRFSSP